LISLKPTIQAQAVGFRLGLAIKKPYILIKCLSKNREFGKKDDLTNHMYSVKKMIQ